MTSKNKHLLILINSASSFVLDAMKGIFATWFRSYASCGDIVKNAPGKSGSMEGRSSTGGKPMTSCMEAYFNIFH